MCLKHFLPINVPNNLWRQVETWLSLYCIISLQNWMRSLPFCSQLVSLESKLPLDTTNCLKYRWEGDAWGVHIWLQSQHYKTKSFWGLPWLSCLTHALLVTSLMGPLAMCPPQYIGTHIWNPSKSFQILSDAVRSIQIFSNPFKSYGCKLKKFKL